MQAEGCKMTSYQGGGLLGPRIRQPEAVTAGGHKPAVKFAAALGIGQSPRLPRRAAFAHVH